ncbi:MAG: hypothetical protein IJX88_03250 [Clostridia bacterium]|nr:hypothetical protein [Clostridia bacterium]
MRRIDSRATLLKRRVKVVQNRAKVAGMIYLLGLLALAALAFCTPFMTGTAVTKSGSTALPVLTFYKPLVALFKNGLAGLKTLSLEQIFNAVTAVLFLAILLTVAIDLLRGFGKLDWLFKRRASYNNGFNRNMYAMDDLADRFTSSFACILTLNILIYMFAGEGVKLTLYAYIAVGTGFAVHFLAGVIGGTVTVFSTGEKIEEQKRDHGLFTYFIRNVFQLAVVAAILYFLTKESVLFVKCKEFIDQIVVKKAGFKSVNIKEYIPAAVEAVLWIFYFAMLRHAVAETEFNRNCLQGAGMKNFAICSFFAALFAGAWVALPYIKIGEATGLNKNLAIVAGVAVVGFLFDCLAKPRQKYDYDDFDADEYIRENGYPYNNTII